MHQLEPNCLIECATIVLAVQTVKASNTRPAGPQISYNNKTHENDNKTHKNDNKTTAKNLLKNSMSVVFECKKNYPPALYSDHYV